MTDTQVIVEQLREWADLIEGCDLEEFYAMEFSMQTNSKEAFQQLREGLTKEGVDLAHAKDFDEVGPYETLTHGYSSYSLRVRFAWIGWMDHEG